MRTSFVSLRYVTKIFGGREVRWLPREASLTYRAEHAL
jgi:hypothetical protein